MAEPTEGMQTSEWRLAKVVMVIGACVDGVAILLEGLKQSGVFPASSWLPVVLGGVGTLSIVLAPLGYTRSRTMVKLAEAAPSLGASLGSTLPLAIQAAKETVYSTRVNPDGSVVRVKEPPMPPVVPPLK